MDRKLLLTGTEVAAALGVSRAAAYAMMASGRLPVVRIGRGVRVPAEALALWVEQATHRSRSRRRGKG
jgi:excisionase family DNA binding protein